MIEIDNTNRENTRLHRRTALIAHELDHFYVDFPALSETKLSGEGLLTEVGGGYTFFWGSYTEGQSRNREVGLAIRTTRMDKIFETQQPSSEKDVVSVSLLQCFCE